MSAVVKEKVEEGGGKKSCQLDLFSEFSNGNFEVKINQCRPSLLDGV